jgi:hypothetical protein
MTHAFKNAVGYAPYSGLCVTCGELVTNGVHSWITIFPPVGSQEAKDFVFPANWRHHPYGRALGVIHLSPDGTLTMEQP